MSEEASLDLAQELEARMRLRFAVEEFARYCFERIFPVYENTHDSLIAMRTDANRWMPAVLQFARRRQPYTAILLAVLKQISPLPNLTENSGPFERFLVTQIRTVINEKIREDDAAKMKT